MMFAGLDFGTSNSALGVINPDCKDKNTVKLLPLYQAETFLPSSIYAYDRSLISDFIEQNLTGDEQQQYRVNRLRQLQAAKAFKRHEGYEPDEMGSFFGKEAIQYYIEHPEEGSYIKSPKSFLGSTGLSSAQLDFFEDIVCAMLLNMKITAEKSLEQSLNRVVIGRPVNYQGVNSQKSNEQAIALMSNAAKSCGFKEVEFLFEPIAAGVDFEVGLKQDKIVLVVDIGGGTTDCSMVKMGPSYIDKADRSDDFLAHTGQRVGGNDLDILLAYQQLMPLFGRGSHRNSSLQNNKTAKNTIEMPDILFWRAVSTNNVADQSDFSSLQFANQLTQLKRDACQPELLQRLIYLQQSKQNHRLVQSAELTKIALSEKNNIEVELNYIEQNLQINISQNGFETAIERPLFKIKNLIEEAIILAAVKPDVVYITGGSAKSPSVRKAINEIVPDTPILDGDYYGSVAAGLTQWANKIWR